MNTALKIQTHPSCPTELSEEQIRLYHRQGFLAFENVLSPEEVERARESVSRLIHHAYKNYPRLPNDYHGGTFSYQKPDGAFFVQTEPGGMDEQRPKGATSPEAPNTFESPLELEYKVRKIANYIDEDAFLHYTCMEHPLLRGVLESLVGKDPIHFQNMGLLKPPFGGIEKPWHQDNAYFSVAPLSSVIGVWLALDEAKSDNGCMHVIPGAHLEGARIHVHDLDCEIEADKLDTKKSLAIELKPGGALFFYGMLPHMTPVNQSAERRRALQYHYRAASSQIVDKETYDRIFAEADGTPASCAMNRKPGQ